MLCLLCAPSQCFEDHDERCAECNAAVVDPDDAVICGHEFDVYCSNECARHSCGECWTEHLIDQMEG